MMLYAGSSTITMKTNDPTFSASSDRQRRRPNNSLSVESGTRGASPNAEPPTASFHSVSRADGDALTWYTPKPSVAPKVGWEDDWMMKWKTDNYSPDQRVRCYRSHKTPYSD